MLYDLGAFLPEKLSVRKFQAFFPQYAELESSTEEQDKDSLLELCCVSHFGQLVLALTLYFFSLYLAYIPGIIVLL